MVFSTTQLKAAAAPATNQMPAQAIKAKRISNALGAPGTAKTMPMRAQKTIN